MTATVHPFPDIPALTKAKAEADRRNVARIARRHKIEAAEVAFMRQGMSGCRARRLALLQLSAKARKMMKLAESVRRAAMDDILACQDDLADMRRRDLQQRADDFCEWASGRGAEIGVTTLAAIREGRQS